MQNSNEINIINLRSGHLKRKLTNEDADNEDGPKDKDEEHKNKDRQNNDFGDSKKCKKSKKKRKKSKKSSKKVDDVKNKIDEKENQKTNNIKVQNTDSSTIEWMKDVRVNVENIAKINPIFLWVDQKDSKIISVLCEDYDKRNRIRLSKIFDGRWTAVPRTDRLVKAIEKTKNKISSDSFCENLVSNNNICIDNAKENSENLFRNDRNDEEETNSCSCPRVPCVYHTVENSDDDEISEELSAERQKKQEVFLGESQKIINCVNTLMELLDGIKENSIKEREEARAKRRNQEIAKEHFNEKKKRRHAKKDILSEKESLEIHKKMTDNCDSNLHSDNVNNQDVTHSTIGHFEDQPDLIPEHIEESNNLSEDFKKNKYIQYNIINKNINADVNKINIKLSYTKTNTKIYDKNESSKHNACTNNTSDVYDFESEDQFSDASNNPKSDTSFEYLAASAKQSSSETIMKNIPSEEIQCEKSKEKSSGEKLSVLEKLAKEKPLTNSFEASFRKFIIENEVPSSSTTKINEPCELDVRLPQINKQCPQESTVKTNVVNNKSETRLLNIKTVQEINNSTLVINKDNERSKYIIDDYRPSPETLEKALTEKKAYLPHEDNQQKMENNLAPFIVKDVQPVQSLEIIKPVQSAGKGICNDMKQFDTHKGIVHRGKTISLEEFENEFVANYDELLAEEESSDDDSSYASGHAGHASHSGVSGFDINLWNNNQSFDHNLNVIEDQHQLQILRDKRLYDLYNRNKDTSTILMHSDPVIPVNSQQSQNEKSDNFDEHRKTSKSDTEDHSFFESIANINKQNLLHESVFPQDEEFIDLEKIQPEKIISDELNQEHLDNICHSAKHLWDVESNVLLTKPLGIESSVLNRGFDIMTESRPTFEDTAKIKTDIMQTNPTETESDKENCVEHKSKSMEVSNQEDNITVESTCSSTCENGEVEQVKDIKKSAQKAKFKDNKLDSIINKIITNKTKEELLQIDRKYKESCFTDKPHSGSGKNILISEVKVEAHEVSEEIIEQIHKSPILTFEVDGYEIIETSKDLLCENKGISHNSELDRTAVNVLVPKKSIENKDIMKNNDSINNAVSIANILSWNHSEHSVDSITNDILSEFCDSNHSDFTKCDKTKGIHNSVVNNKTIKSWLENSSHSANSINLKNIENKVGANDLKNNDESCGKLHNTLKLPKETMIYPIPESDDVSEVENGKPGAEIKVLDSSKAEICSKNVDISVDNNNKNEINTMDLSMKHINEVKDAEEKTSKVGIIKIRKSSELFMNSEQTEPLDLGNHNNEKCTNGASGEKVVAKSNEEITIKSLLTTNIKKLKSEEVITKSENSKLLELLTNDTDGLLLNQINEANTHNIEHVSTDKIKSRENVKNSELHSQQPPKSTHRAIENSEPIEQLKAILSNPNIVVPDPLLVPRSRLPALVTAPAREIPKLMSNIIDYNKMNNELLVISLNNLQKLIKTTDKDDEKLIYNQQLNYLKEQYSKINRTGNPPDQNLLNYLDGNNNNKELLNNMLLGYNELLNPFMQPSMDPAVHTNQMAYNNVNVDNLMNMLMYKQYNEVYSKETMKQNQMKEMLQHKEKDAFLKEFYSLIQNKYPHYTPLEIFDTMKVIQKDVNSNHANGSTTVRDMLRNHHQNKERYNNLQQAQKEAKTYQQTVHKRDPSYAYQSSQEQYKKKQASYSTSVNYSNAHSHQKRPVDKMNKFHEMYAMSQQKSSPQVNPYEKYYQQQQQHLYNPLLAAKLNSQPTYFNQPDLSLLSQYGSMGNSMMGMSPNIPNGDQLKKLQEEYLVFQQQLQTQQQTYLNHQQMHHQQNSEKMFANKISSRNHPQSSKHSKSPFDAKPVPLRSPASRAVPSNETKLNTSSSEHAFYNATRNELQHNYEASHPREKPRDVPAKTESNRQFEQTLYGGTVNEMRNYYNYAKSDGSIVEPARAEKTPSTSSSDSGAPSTPKLKIKSNIIDTTTKPKLLKIADPEQQMTPVPPLFHHPFAGMNPMMSHPGQEQHHPMEDVHPYLWHPLFGK